MGISQQRYDISATTNTLIRKMSNGSYRSSLVTDDGSAIDLPAVGIVKMSSGTLTSAASSFIQANAAVITLQTGCDSGDDAAYVSKISIGVGSANHDIQLLSRAGRVTLFSGSPGAEDFIEIGYGNIELSTRTVSGVHKGYLNLSQNGDIVIGSGSLSSFFFRSSKFNINLLPTGSEFASLSSGDVFTNGTMLTGSYALYIKA